MTKKKSEYVEVTANVKDITIYEPVEVSVNIADITIVKPEEFSIPFKVTEKDGCKRNKK